MKALGQIPGRICKLANRLPKLPKLSPGDRNDIILVLAVFAVLMCAWLITRATAPSYAAQREAIAADAISTGAGEIYRLPETSVPQEEEPSVEPALRVLPDDWQFMADCAAIDEAYPPEPPPRAEPVETSASETYLLARMVHAESHWEAYAGKLAVAQVAIDRWERNPGRTLEGILTAPGSSCLRGTNTGAMIAWRRHRTR